MIARALRAEAHVLEEQDSFLALVSHQFKTPLASLQLSLETLALRAPTPEAARTLIDRMLADLARMELMVTQILESARLERGRVEFKSEPLRARGRRGARGDAARGARPPGAHQHLQRHRAADLYVAERPAGARCRGAQRARERARGRGAGAAAAASRSAAARVDGEVELSVRDSGVGFAPADGARLFEKFTRLPGSGAGYYGTGLGLFIVRRLMELARGRVSAHSEGVGTGRELRAHLAGGRAGAARRERGGRTAAPHVLVVEDDPHLAAGVMENLRAEGYEVSVAGDGEQALAWLSGHGCALIVLDVMLPGIDGFGVCRTLREQGNNTPVLFLTARGDPADRVRGLESGGDDYLAKPFHLQEFLLRVRAILRRWDWYRSASARPPRRCCASAATKWTSAPSARAPGTARRRSSPRRKR